MKNLKVFSLALIGALTLTACGAPGRPAAVIANSAIGSAGCKLSQSDMWDSLQRVAEDGAQFPSLRELRSALLQAAQERGFSGPTLDEYVEAFLENYQVVMTGVNEKLGPQSTATWKKALAEAEVGIRVTEAHKELHAALQNSLAKLAEAEVRLQAVCANPDSDPTPPVPGPSANQKTIWEQLLATQNPEVFGARKTLAVAYQSCDVLGLPAMTTATPSVQGIQIVGTHPAGGKKREIASIASVNSTHYYIKDNRLAKNSCFEVRNSPLIYDFGGKPYTSSTNTRLLDLFKNGGSGTSVLGIDCSAYVFSALALAGLKMDPDPKKPLKADLVHAIGSGAFKEPQSNGLRCLEKISVTATSSIAAGDIAAINGHVVMIDAVGEDPFGLRNIASATDCNSTKLTITNFDFVIAQSSPSKSGIGINRYQARDYLKESSTFKTGLTAYAVAACRAKFGLSPNLSSPSLSVVRHKRTPECLATALVAQNESCVADCRAP